VVFEQRLEWAQPEDFVEDFAGETFAFGEAERNDFIVDGVANEDENFVAGGIAVGFAEFFEIETIEDFAVQVGFYLLVLAVLEGLEIRHKSLILRALEVCRPYGICSTLLLLFPRHCRAGLSNAAPTGWICQTFIVPLHKTSRNAFIRS